MWEARPVTEKPRRDPEVVQAIAARIDAALETAKARSGITQNEVARRAGIKSPGAMARYRTGKRTPSAETIRKIAEATGTTAEFLLFGRGPEPSGRRETERPELDRAIQLIEASNDYHPECVAYLRRIAKGYPGDRPWIEWMMEADLFNKRLGAIG
jgi:transcriptional regulator with XRE-family HTH domain